MGYFNGTTITNKRHGIKVSSCQCLKAEKACFPAFERWLLRPFVSGCNGRKLNAKIEKGSVSPYPPGLVGGYNLHGVM